MTGNISGDMRDCGKALYRRRNDVFDSSDACENTGPRRCEHCLIWLPQMRRFLISDVRLS